MAPRRRGRGEPAAVVSVALDTDQAEWLRAHGDDPAATLRGLLDAARRRQTLELAVAEERRIELLIRRRARWLAARQPAPQTEAEFRQVVALDEQAARAVLPALDRSPDPRVRHAARRFRFRFGIRSDGTHTGRAGDRAQLQRLREERPGGWRPGAAGRSAPRRRPE